jgi:hypothetical protein
LTKSNLAKELNRENLLKEVFADRRIRNAGAFGLALFYNLVQENFYDMFLNLML